jgi:hypothetical protein
MIERMEHPPLRPDSTRHLETMRSEVRSFKEGLAKADGTLFELRKTTPDGKKLFISARFVRAPQENLNGDAEPEFWGWYRRHLPISSVLLLDVYAQTESGIVPLGHMDWSLQDGEANGSGNMHEAVRAKNEHEMLARDMWSTGTAFKTSPEYQKQNIGTLMIASSASVLPAVGARKFYTGALLPPAENTYGRFGLSEEDFFNEGKISPLPISRLSENVLVDKIISEFV